MVMTLAKDFDISIRRPTKDGTKDISCECTFSEIPFTHSYKCVYACNRGPPVVPLLFTFNLFSVPPCFLALMPKKTEIHLATILCKLISYLLLKGVAYLTCNRMMSHFMNTLSSCV